MLIFPGYSVPGYMLGTISIVGVYLRNDSRHSKLVRLRKLIDLDIGIFASSSQLYKGTQDLSFQAVKGLLCTSNALPLDAGQVSRAICHLHKSCLFSLTSSAQTVFRFVTRNEPL